MRGLLAVVGGVWAPECVDSVVEAHRLSCPVACGILIPGPGIEPMSPALAGRFLTTGPPGKSLQPHCYTIGDFDRGILLLSKLKTDSSKQVLAWISELSF